MKNKKSFLYVMLTIAFPIALQNLLTTTASMVDTIMIGRLGESCVAAVGICSQISSLFFSCYWGFACSFPSTGEQMMKRGLTVHSVSLSSVWQSWDLHLHLCVLSDRNSYWGYIQIKKYLSGSESRICGSSDGHIRFRYLLYLSASCYGQQSG